MENKTPKFDLLIDEFLSKFKGGTHTCAQTGLYKYCENNFEITSDDIIFLKKFKVLPPKLCPTCRRTRRYAFINQIDIFKRPCGVEGHTEQVISTLPPASPYITYDSAYYRSDKWNPMDYGIKFDDSKSFFSEFSSFRNKVPHPAITSDPSNINSDYSVNGKNLKNGYRVTGGRNSENIWYTVITFDSREMMDCFYVDKSENCYGSVFSSTNYNSDFLFFSDNCLNCSFMYDCKKCSDCIGGVNLRDKKYVFFGEQLTKEEFEDKKKSFSISSIKKQREITKMFWDLVKKNPVRGSHLLNSPGTTGVLSNFSKNCFDTISVFKSEDTRHCDTVTNVKNSMDASTSSGGENLYETVSVGSASSDIKFSVLTKSCVGGEFLINCRNCSNCFACIGLENKSYCIFNKQYDKDSYWKEVDSIKTKMFHDEDYGEFMPISMSCFSYNCSMANYSFPLFQTEAEKIGAFWQPEIESDTAQLDLISVSSLPDDIKDVDSSILKKAIVCEATGKPYRITNTELEYLKRRNIALPTMCPKERMSRRFEVISSYRKYSDVCQNCGVSIESMYPPKSGWIIWCDECYLKGVA